MRSSTLAYLSLMIVCGFCSASDPLEKPRINLDQIRHVVWGRNLTLDCEITVDDNTSLTMSWKVPESVPEERWSYSQPPILMGNITNGSCTWKTVLTVSSVEKTDEGDYICVAGNISDHVESRASISYRIWDPSHYYINATVNGSTDLVLGERESVMWTIVVDTYPENVTLEWFKPDGHEIVTNEQDKQSKYSHTREGMAHYFSVSQLKVEDTGNYTIVLSTEKNETTVNLKLTVRARRPFVRLDKPLTLYHTGESVNFTCRTSGLPLPNVTWIIEKYPDFASKDNSERSYPSNFIDKPETKGPYYSVSTLNVKITHTVDLTCESCNDIDCVNSTEQILVSGTSKTFGIIGPDRSEVIVGDDISVTCEADGYIYSNSVSWSPEKPGFQLSRINATRSRSNTSWQSTLNIRNVQKSDTGTYICEATTQRGHSIKKEKHRLIVHDASAPRLRPPGMNNATTLIDLESQPDRSITLNCSAEGTSIPRITWYKDKEPISSNNQYKFSENNSTLEITHFLSGDGGRYSCEAKNRYGTATSYTDIEIAGESQSNTLWIIVICVLVVILVVVTIFSVVKVSRAKRSRKKLIDNSGLAHFDNGIVGFPYLDSIDRSEPADYFMINNRERGRTVESQIREVAEQSTEL